jgi:CelD/BcsL family acetyltransferase involved in cellulose biosynthesis
VTVPTESPQRVAGAQRDAGPPRLRRVALDDPDWVAFVHRCGQAGAFHHPAWAALLARTYVLPGFALVLADERGRLVAGAPFLEARSVTRRRRLISLPFTDACPPLAAGDEAPRFLEALAEAAAHPLEIRWDVRALGWTNRTDAVIHVLELDPDADVVRRRFARAQVTRNIRRAEREGVTVRAATSPEDLATFYALHVRTRRRQGVPVQPRRFFDAIWSDMVEPGLGEILLASAGGPPLAAALLLSFNGTTIYKFGASDPEGWPLRPNHAIFWSAIQGSCARGDRWFDFGRTDLDNDGLRAFKSSWGAVEQPLVCSVLERGAAAAGQGVAVRMAATAIRRGPAWVGRGIGARLYRYAASR